MTIDEIRVGSIVTGSLWPEPVEVLTLVSLGDSVKLIGKGCRTGLVHDPVLTPAQLAQLRGSPLRESFDGDPALPPPRAVHSGDGPDGPRRRDRAHRGGLRHPA